MKRCYLGGNSQPGKRDKRGDLIEHHREMSGMENMNKKMYLS